MVNTKPYLSSTFFGRVVIRFSKEILYIVRSSIYPLVSFFIKSFGRSITNLLSHSFKYKSSEFGLDLYWKKLCRNDFGKVWIDNWVLRTRIKIKECDSFYFCFK